MPPDLRRGHAKSAQLLPTDVPEVSPAEGAFFHRCGMCGAEWATRDLFLADPAVQLIGVQPTTDASHGGLFLFNHLTPDCGTTLSLHLVLFADMCPPHTLVRRNAEPNAPRPRFCLHPPAGPCPDTCMCTAMQLVARKIADVKRLTGGSES